MIPEKANALSRGFTPYRDWAKCREAYYADLYDRESGRRALRMALRKLRRQVVVSFGRDLQTIARWFHG